LQSHLSPLSREAKSCVSTGDFYDSRSKNRLHNMKISIRSSQIAELGQALPAKMNSTVLKQQADGSTIFDYRLKTIANRHPIVQFLVGDACPAWLHFIFSISHKTNALVVCIATLFNA